MASLRKRYQTTESKDAPVSSPPEVTAAELPEPVADAKPPEQPETESPADKAAQNELKKRLAEMERAEGLQQQRQQQPPPEPQAPQEPTLEQIIAGFPERVKRWYRAHPELLTDPERAAQVQYCHHVARREVGEEMTEPYFDRMEQMLGFKQAPKNGQAESRPTPQPTNHAPRPAAPRQQAAPRMSAPVSAPPTRQAPSMATGRVPNYRAALNRDELEIAAASGQTPEEYQQKKELWQRMKAEGHQ